MFLVVREEIATKSPLELIICLLPNSITAVVKEQVTSNSDMVDLTQELFGWNPSRTFAIHIEFYTCFLHFLPINMVILF
jgi:hypothetical protein